MADELAVAAVLFADAGHEDAADVLPGYDIFTLRW
jgi:hypothetical protein